MLKNNKIKSSEILVLWDVMLDKYSYWNVKRLNPEWPNPLLNIKKEEYKLWGSANVAANISSLNWTCDLIWIVWDDDNQEVFQAKCSDNNIRFHKIISCYPTITKCRFIENTYNQQLLRVDYEKFFHINSSDIEKIMGIIKENNYKLIVISDYNKWIITEELINKIKEYSVKNDIKVLVDSKPYNFTLFKDFYLIKPNFREFCKMIKTEIKNSDEDIKKYALEFAKKMNTNLVITRWAKWASLITKSWECFHMETKSQKVFDVTWAWDTFIATIAYAIYNWIDLKKAVKFWNKASSVVIEKVWTAVIKSEELF